MGSKSWVQSPEPLTSVLGHARLVERGGSRAPLASTSPPPRHICKSSSWSLTPNFRFYRPLNATIIFDQSWERMDWMYQCLWHTTEWTQKVLNDAVVWIYVMMFVLEPIHMLANLTTYTYYNLSMAWHIAYTIESCISQSICNDLCWLCHGTSEVDCYVCIMKWSVISHAIMARVLVSTRGMILCFNHCIHCNSVSLIVVCVCCVNVVVWMISLMQIYSVDLSAHHCSVDCCIPHFLMEYSLLLV